MSVKILMYSTPKRLKPMAVSSPVQSGWRISLQTCDNVILLHSALTMCKIESIQFPVYMYLIINVIDCLFTASIILWIASFRMLSCIFLAFVLASLSFSCRSVGGFYISLLVICVLNIFLWFANWIFNVYKVF